MSTTTAEPVEKGMETKIILRFNEAEIENCSALFELDSPATGPELLAVGVILTALHQKLPGEGARSVSHLFEFLAPIDIDDELQISLAVEKRETAKNLATIKVNVVNQSGIQVLTGRAVMLLTKNNPVSTL